MKLWGDQCWIQDFPDWRYQPENYMKMKKFWAGGHASPCAPLDSPLWMNLNLNTFVNNERKVFEGLCLCDKFFEMPFLHCKSLAWRVTSLPVENLSFGPTISLYLNSRLSGIDLIACTLDLSCSILQKTYTFRSVPQVSTLLRYRSASVALRNEMRNPSPIGEEAHRRGNPTWLWNQRANITRN